MVSIVKKYRLQVFDEILKEYRNVKPLCDAHGDPYDEDGVYYHTREQGEDMCDVIAKNPEAPAFRIIPEYA